MFYPFRDVKDALSTNGGHGRRCTGVGDFDTCLRIWEEAVGKGIDMGRQGKMLLVEAAMQVPNLKSAYLFSALAFSAFAILY